MITDEERKAIADQVARAHGTTARYFEPGTRAGILKRERMANIKKNVKTLTPRQVVYEATKPVDMELIVRGGKPNGKLD